MGGDIDNYLLVYLELKKIFISLSCLLCRIDSKFGMCVCR